MSLPEQMTDRWQNRPEPPPGEGVVSWHMLMCDYPEVVDLARQAQQRLAGLDGLHMTPLAWLHMTTLLAGPASDFSPDKLRQMAETAADLLASTPPAAVTLGQVLYHPEAIMLGVTPAETLTAIHDAARWATHQVTGEQAPDGPPARWRPHVTICYSTSSQPAKPIIDALGTRLPKCDINIGAVSLVIQHGPERAWDWSVVSTIRFATSART
ncbi:MAG TPA: 2'-5' RNA ligase family protein [Mycobacterium sp.]|jgi:2'-5' RNA ligase|nr:2'-5' RNA ligase family protein [Mycobacterium sp.]